MFNNVYILVFFLHTYKLYFFREPVRLRPRFSVSMSGLQIISIMFYSNFSLACSNLNVDYKISIFLVNDCCF